MAATAALCLASCNREVLSEPGSGPVGKYQLTELTASVEDVGTKTSLAANNVVKWSTGDRIAVKGADGALHYYELCEGAGTSVGTFKLVLGETAATFNVAGDITAIYPANAASLEGGNLYISINQDYAGDYMDHGLTDWGINYQWDFRHNDIKVAVPISNPENDNPNLNFKFKQLGVWCNFTFDFKESELYSGNYQLDKIERIYITTNNNKKISGKAQLTGTSLGTATGTDSETISRILTSPLPMNTTQSFGFMMFPEVDTNTEFQITLITSDHTFTFQGKPIQNLEAGTTLTFPIQVDKNFTQGTGALRYSMVENTPDAPLYYYGGINCLLLDKDATEGTLSVKQYATNKYFADVKLTPAVSIPAKSAQILWKEGDLLFTPTIDQVNEKLDLGTVSGHGNALVAIYASTNCTGDILWSYHIWKPEVNPTTKMYKNTFSGAYQVMDMNLGAMKPAVYGDLNAENDAINTAAAGLYYQWGRKDPMGRIKDVSNNSKGLATVTGIITDWPFVWQVGGAGGTDDGTSSDNNYLKKLYDAYAAGAGESAKPRYRYTIEWSIKNPVTFIKSNDGKRDWVTIAEDSSCQFLWGNPEGYNNPPMSQTYRSIFDPSPEHYRVPPRDLWVNFTVTHTNMYNGISGVDNWAYYINVAQEGRYYDTDPESPTYGRYDPPASSSSFKRGWLFYYNGYQKEGQTNTDTDFYIGVGWRNSTDSNTWIQYANTTLYWTSSPSAEGAIKSSDLGSHINAASIFDSYDRAKGLSIRCVQEP